MRTWLKRKPSSPGNSERSGRTNSFRASASNVAPTPAPSSSSSATAPRWKSRPSTAPRWTTARSSGSSRSMRAARSAWIVGGTALAPDRRRRAPEAARRTAGCPRRSPPRARERRRKLPSERVDERVGVRGAEGLELDERRARAGRRPRRPQVEEIGPGGAEDEDRGLGRRGGDVLDQVEQRRVGPVDVVDDERERRVTRRAPRRAGGTPTQSRRASLLPRVRRPRRGRGARPRLRARPRRGAAPRPRRRARRPRAAGT